jgi:hypothetical protein
MDFDREIQFFFSNLVAKLNKTCNNPIWSIRRMYWDDQGFNYDPPCEDSNGYNNNLCNNCREILIKYEHKYNKLLLLRKITQKLNL